MNNRRQHPTYARWCFSSLALGLSMSLMACGGEPDQDKEGSTSESETDTQASSDTGEAPATNTGGSGVDSSGQDSTTPSESVSSESSSTATDGSGETSSSEPPQPTLNLSYSSITQDSVLLTWKTPMDQPADKVRYILGYPDAVDEALHFAESAVYSTASQDGPATISVSLFNPASGIHVKEQVTIPQDHGKDLPDFSTVERPELTLSNYGFQSVRLGLNLSELAVVSKTPTMALANKVAPSQFHVLVDGVEQTAAFGDGATSFGAGNQTLKGFYPGRSYNFQIQSSTASAGSEIPSEVLTVKFADLPEKEFEISVPPGETLSVNATDGARMPDFVRLNDMQVSVYVDGEKLADGCAVEINDFWAQDAEQAVGQKVVPMFVGIKDGCFTATTKGAERKVVFEVSVQVAATGETFVAKSTNTNIVHQNR